MELYKNDDVTDDESYLTELEYQEDIEQPDVLAESHQEESGPLVGPTEEIAQVYDRIMTGWDPVPPIAGQKRPHSPEMQLIRTKRGREVVRHDYKRLNQGISAQIWTDPQTWNEAMTSAEAALWKAAANHEFRSLKEKGAIKIIKLSELPKGRKPMRNKWVFKKKLNADGTIERYKARCTVKGFTQRKGIDFTETFAPTPRSETGRILLVLAHQFGWHRRQGDVPTAFLNPNLDIDLYMEMPQGFEREGCVILLRKGLYGLKQAAALWYDDAKATLAENGLHPTTSDICLYTNKQKDIYAMMYVDDFQIMGPNLKKIEELMRVLHQRYQLKTVNTDLFLGIHISNPSRDTLLLSQGRYARTLIERHGLKDCKPASSPLERLLEPNGLECPLHLKAEFNSIIGGLQYLSNNTRPDICFAVNHLARFLVKPSLEHIQAALRVLRYISKEPDRGITFTRKEGRPLLEAFTDADFAADPATSRSTSGTVIMLASGPISWRSRLQREVVLSTTEAEYLAATETCRELRWIKSLLKELGIRNRIEGSRCTKLKVDNQSAISLIKNHDNHKRSKHVALRNYFCREQYQDGRIEAIYVPSKNQLADSLTKVKSPVAIQ